MKLKLSKKIRIIIIALILSLCISTSFTLADNEHHDILQYDLGIRFEQDQSNEKLIHVMLEMSDEDSVASFNVSVDIDVEEEAEVEFTFNDNNLPDLPNSDLKQGKIEQQTNVDGKKVKKLNIYYVGTDELNPESSNKLEIGTLNFNHIDGDNTTIKIDSVENKSAVSSVSHKDNLLNINEFTTVVNKKDNAGDDNQQEDTNNPDVNNPDENDDAGNQPSGDNNGSGNIVDQFINSLKTGANKSITWIIITIGVLTVIAIIILKLKKRQKDVK